MKVSEMTELVKEIKTESIKGHYFDNISNENDGLITEYEKIIIRFYEANTKIHALVLFHHDGYSDSVEKMAFSIDRNVFNQSFKRQFIKWFSIKYC